jgi:hypothetical protein
MDKIIDFLRFIKSILAYFSNLQIFGLHIDLFLHFIVSFILIFILVTRFTLKKSIILVVVLLFLKELLDVFAKSRLEYIRPPTIDFILDILSGCLGIGLAVIIYQKKMNKPRYL